MRTVEEPILVFLNFCPVVFHQGPHQILFLLLLLAFSFKLLSSLNSYYYIPSPYNRGFSKYA